MALKVRMPAGTVIAPSDTDVVLPLASEPVHGVLPDGPPGMDQFTVKEVITFVPPLRIVTDGVMLEVQRLPLAPVTPIACASRVTEGVFGSYPFKVLPQLPSHVWSKG